MRLGDTGSIIEYHLARNKDLHFLVLSIDEDDMITNIFWSDGKMMVDCFHFGDVYFGKTHRKIKEACPFSFFVGANHHKQSIIFGAAL